ncbi:ethanolamine ammonia-lyase small subunit [Novosphingobium barchaimii LL02]|uniref:Ethanolamine ammonia-lyase small subunit n=1 Tax=Novosphingobium barchaimii LL02 TaxID=1114963 RepID=A0A0J7XXY4_9SPHN|nr:ethanolamine ammonia-lyase subunit EutC [Novosphingobium barchaimii]KMS56133.1 ethanolamine ammonia-lyase small subunit [Novosphingobium barchaimii LL02]
MSDVPDVPSLRLRRATPARIGLGRAGSGIPTAPLLEFQLAHALARDAVQTPLDADALAATLVRAGLPPPLILATGAGDRTTYLARPDLGRRLDHASRQLLEDTPAPPCDVAVVIADGLSAPAVESHAPPLLRALQTRLANWNWARVSIVRQGRVAVGDEIGALLSADLVLVLIGERPGLSSSDSLGAYLTWAPGPARCDAERNCVSNIRPPHGLTPDQAADKLAWLMTQARRRRLTGTALKDEHTALPP